MTDNPTPAPPEADVTAAEFALGLLDGAERGSALRRLLADPAFAQEVEQWRAHFGLLLDEVPPVAAPADGLARLEAAVALASSESSPAVLRRWQAVAAVATLLAASLLLVVAIRPAAMAPQTPPQTARVAARDAAAPMLVAQIAPAGDRPVVAALYDPATGRLRVAATRLVDAGHSAELWVIPRDGVARSLGVLNPAGATAVTVSPDRRAHLAPGSTLAVTVEQLGGSPTGKAQGAVVASGGLSLV